MARDKMEDDDEEGDGKGDSDAGEPVEAAAEPEEPEEDAIEEARLFDLLARLRLGRFAGALRELGVESVGDLAYLQDADLERLSMPMIPRRKLLEAAGGDWRSTGGAARPAATPPPEPAAAGAARAEAEGAEADADEVAQLVRDAERLIEDFCAANDLGGPARAELLGIPPRAALRAMGLIGRGNAFVMQGVRRPSAAARSRVRVAAAAESAGGDRVGGQPYEDWKRLVEGFAQVNGLATGGEAWDSLRGLDKRDALRTMGFTSGLPFLLRSDAGETAEEQWLRNLEDFVHINELDERSARALNEVPKQVALQVMGLVGRENSFVIRNARNTSAAVMHRLQHVQERGRDKGSPADAEPFAQLPKLIEDFIFVNSFDERGVEAMRTLRPDIALQVMGFTAENAFLVRGVKNPSAALIARIANAQRRPGRGGGGGHHRGSGP